MHSWLDRKSSWRLEGRRLSCSEDFFIDQPGWLQMENPTIRRDIAPTFHHAKWSFSLYKHRRALYCVNCCPLGIHWAWSSWKKDSPSAAPSHGFSFLPIWAVLSFYLPSWGLSTGVVVNICQMWACEALGDLFVIKSDINKMWRDFFTWLQPAASSSFIHGRHLTLLWKEEKSRIYASKFNRAWTETLAWVNASLCGCHHTFCKACYADFSVKSGRKKWLAITVNIKQVLEDRRERQKLINFSFEE